MGYSSSLAGQFVYAVFTLYKFCIIVRVLFTWFPGHRRGILREIEDFVFFMTEPIMGFLRRMIPPVMFGAGGIDFSPIVALIVIDILHNFLQRIFY